MKLTKIILEKLNNYFNSYRRRGGIHVFSSMIIAKIAAFILSIIVVRLLTKNVYGDISYAKSIIAALLPFIGFGAAHAILRFCSIEEEVSKKAWVFRYGFTRGLLITIALVAGVFIVFSIIKIKLETAKPYLFIMSFQLLTSFILISLQNYTRTLHLNIKYSYSQIIQALTILVMGLVLVFLFDGYGLVISYVIAPFIAGIYLITQTKHKLNHREEHKKTGVWKKKFWKYGFNIGLGSIASHLLYSIDILIIGYIIADSSIIAEYKVATIIPLNLLFIPSSLLITDFVKIAKNYKEKRFLKKYSLGISLVLFIIGFIILVVIFIFGKDIIRILFGNDYIITDKILKVLSVGMFFSFFLRIPFGNIIAAVGKASWNVYIAYFKLGLNIILNLVLIRKYGIIGAAYATSITMLISGLLSLGTFFLYINRIEFYTKKEKDLKINSIENTIQD
jgi:O-antigen/teichoic acid export membrane protein